MHFEDDFQSRFYCYRVRGAYIYTVVCTLTIVCYSISRSMKLLSAHYSLVVRSPTAVLDYLSSVPNTKILSCKLLQQAPFNESREMASVLITFGPFFLYFRSLN